MLQKIMFNYYDYILNIINLKKSQERDFSLVLLSTDIISLIFA